MGQLHPAAPNLERQQTGKAAAALLIEGGHDTIDGLVLSSHSPVRMCCTSGARAMMQSTSRFRFAHGSVSHVRRHSGALSALSLHQKRTSYSLTNPNALYTVNVTTGVATLIAGGIDDFESLAIACPSQGPSADFKGSTQTDGGCYDINGFRGCVFHDQGEHFASGGNHYRDQSILITSEGYEVCIALPTGYMATGTHINQSKFIEYAYCYTDKQGARVDFGIDHIEVDGEQVANASAALPEAEAVAAEAVVGYAIGVAGGEFSCSDALVIVPPAIVGDGTRFLCSSSVGSATSAAPPGLSLIAPRVDLTTEPERKSFDQSLTICLPFSVNDVLKAGGSEANLVVGYFDSSFWQSLSKTPSPEPSLICGLTDHLSIFGLLARVPHALPATGSNAGTSIWLTIALGFVLPVLAGILMRRRNTSAR